MGLYRGWRWGGGGGGSVPPVFPGSAYARGLYLCVCLLNFSVCMSISLSVYLSLSICICLSVCLSAFVSFSPSLSPPPSPPLPPPLSLSLSLSLSMCGVDLADQGSRARYRAIQVLSWDSKSVLFPVEAHYPNYASFIRNHYMRGSRKFCQRGSNLDYVF